MTSKVGDVVEFSGVNQEGKKVSLSDFKGKNVVLYFYPKDNTPGCTIEGQDFTHLFSEFKKKNTIVIGVSADSIESHCKFIDKRDLHIMLLSDPEKKIIKAFGVWAPKKFMGREFLGIVRSTFLIDGKSKIVKVWSPVSVKGHAKEVLDSVV